MEPPLCKKKGVIYNPLLHRDGSMTLQTHPLRRIFARFFPRRYSSAQSEPRQEWDAIPVEQRHEWALRYLAQGELALLQANLNALSFFEAASQIDPQNPRIWYRQGLAFFEYGSEEGKEKSLLLAAKHFKFAVQIDPAYFDAYVAWGNTLLQLGRFHAEYHFLSEAKEKYQKALELSEAQPKDILSELYWDFGIVWSEIAKSSGEALDLRLAIDSFQKAADLLDGGPPEFFNDFGKAYLEMGLLINDARHYSQAVVHLQRAVQAAPNYVDGWATLAECYSQLYLNTMDERYVVKASDAYANAIRISPPDADLWLSWAQILSESGRLTEDPKLLRASCEKCARAATIDLKDPLITAQWVESLSHLGALTSRLDLLIEAENKILKATDLYPDDPDLWLSYGICLNAFGRYYEDPEYYEMAIEKLQWGLSIDRTSAEHWHALGSAHSALADLLDCPELLERAGRFFARASDLKPSYPALLFDSARTALLYSRMEGNLPALEDAILHFESLVQGHKESILHHPEWLFEYASALEWLGDFSGEEAHYSRAIEIFSHVLLIHPDFLHIHRHLAICYLERGHITLDSDHYKKAIQFFRLAARQDEENDQIWLDWGTCLIYLAGQTHDPDFRNQLYWDAEQKISRAGQLGNPYAYYNLACVYSILDRTGEAFDFIKKALDARALPTLDEMAEDEWLDNLRGRPEFTQFFSALEAKLQQTREE
jgi:tetratricopeptide (TPR) repeat protein